MNTHRGDQDKCRPATKESEQPIPANCAKVDLKVAPKGKMELDNNSDPIEDFSASLTNDPGLNRVNKHTGALLSVHVNIKEIRTEPSQTKMLLSAIQLSDWALLLPKLTMDPAL